MTAAVIETCSKLPPLSLAPAANDRRCHSHLQQITAVAFHTCSK
jgi:hypothetical protein